MKPSQYIKNLFMDIFLWVMKTFRYLCVKLGVLDLSDGQYGAFDYKGLRCSSTVHSFEHMEMCEQFDAFREESDVIVLTYPKAGTHFLAGVIRSIYSEKGLLGKENGHMLDIPFEMSPPGMKPQQALNMLKSRNGHRVINTHLPWSYLPSRIKSHQVKVIHCLRNPKDVACSAYPFLKQVGVLTESTTWEQFLDYFIHDKIIGGDFFEFIHQWYPNRNSPNNLQVYYEDMIEDLERETRKIAEFLGVELTNEELGRVVKDNTFSTMKKKLGNSVFHRQGKSGTWKSQFTVAQNEAADRWIERGMVGLDDIKFKYG